MSNDGIVNALRNLEASGMPMENAFHVAVNECIPSVVGGQSNLDDAYFRLVSGIKEICAKRDIPVPAAASEVK